MKSTILKLAGVAVATSSALVFAVGGSASANNSDLTLSLLAGRNDGTVPITSGLSDTPFGVQLQPTVAANGVVNNRANCSFDSATGGTFVYTYLIPATDNESQDNFATGEPGVLSNGDTALALFLADGTIETDGNDTNTAAGTGQVNLPPTDKFSFGEITDPVNGGGVPVSTLTGTDNGQWLGGYACYRNGVTTTDYWQFHVTFTATAPGPGNSQGFSWVVVPDGQPPASTPEVPLPILLPLGAAGLVAGSVVFARRRRHNSPAAA